MIRHVDTRRDVASQRRRMGRSASWPLISKHPIARQPDLRLSTPAVAYCYAIGWRGTLGECGVDDMHQVRYVAQGMLRPSGLSAFQRALVTGLDLRCHRSSSSPGSMDIGLHAATQPTAARGAHLHQALLHKHVKKHVTMSLKCLRYERGIES